MTSREKPFELTDELKRKFYEDGYLIIPDFFPRKDAERLKRRADDLLCDFDISSHPMTKFTTGEREGTKHIGDDYFLTSGDKVRFFFEEEAFDSDGNLVKPKERAINKIGHALHVLDPVFREFSHRKGVLNIVRKLELVKPVMIQSMVICKQPEIGGEVVPHQDSTFLFTSPPSAVGFWFALEDCTPTNGCLTFVPGSHKSHPIARRLVRLPESQGGGTGFVNVDSSGVEQASKPPSNGTAATKPYADIPPSTFVPGPVPAGALVLIHGGVVHSSAANRSPNSRYIYTFHCIDGALPYDEGNWLQPSPALPFDSLYDYDEGKTATMPQ